ncbi:MAG: 50S ribosomal protein L16 [Nanoarchaeota archaeon]|nr:50S ribosomal protein L16 [Nanoarchaeota archaeon]MBU4086472.1 50S ribosomal protein L16 [Nanoarchaeota archaeon]
MALRKASSYSKFSARPYTRKSSKKSKSYIKTVPPQKVVKLQMGNISAYNQGKFSIIISLMSTENVQMRDNAIEAARQSIHKELEVAFPNQYYFGVKVYPHHILRENRMLTGAGADRMQTGMTQSFGTTIGRAALVKPNQTIFVIAVNSEKAVQVTRKAISKIKAKLPCKTRIQTEKIKQE